MSTAIQARTQVSTDIGDLFASTVTANGAANGSTLIDDTLTDIVDDSLLQPNQTASFLITAGDALNEERTIASKVTNTATMRRNFSTQIDSGDTYELHRQFSAAEKDRAVTQAIDLIFPMIWKAITFNVTIVADQFDYDITGAGFYNDTPHQVLRVSKGDTELTTKIYDWDIRYDVGGAIKLHLFTRFETGITMRLFGIAKPVLADIAGNDLLILSSRAAMYLYETNLSSVQFDSVQVVERALALQTKMFNERVIRFMRMAMPKTIRTKALRNLRTDINFRVT